VVEKVAEVISERKKVAEANPRWQKRGWRWNNGQKSF